MQWSTSSFLYFKVSGGESSCPTVCWPAFLSQCLLVSLHPVPLYVGQPFCPIVWRSAFLSHYLAVRLPVPMSGGQPSCTMSGCQPSFCPTVCQSVFLFQCLVINQHFLLSGSQLSCTTVSLPFPLSAGLSSCPIVCRSVFLSLCLELSLLLPMPGGHLPVSLSGEQHRNFTVWRSKLSACLPHSLAVRLCFPYPAAYLPVLIFSKPNQTSCLAAN